MSGVGALAPTSNLNMKDNEYKFKPHAGWDDKVSWYAIAFICIVNLINWYWAFYW